MTDLSFTEVRGRLAEAIDQTQRTGEPVYITRHSNRVAVLIAVDVYDQVVATAEDVLDRAELERSRLEDDFVPWDEVKADLGLV